MSAIQIVIDDASKGYRHTFQATHLSANFSMQIKKTIERDGVLLSTDDSNTQINVSGSIQTNEDIIQLEMQDPRVREFITLLMEKATEKYNFPAEEMARIATTSKTSKTTAV